MLRKRDGRLVLIALSYLFQNDKIGRGSKIRGREQSWNQCIIWTIFITDSHSKSGCTGADFCTLIVKSLYNLSNFSYRFSLSNRGIKEVTSLRCLLRFSFLFFLLHATALCSGTSFSVTEPTDKQINFITTGVLFSCLSIVSYSWMYHIDMKSWWWVCII